MKYLILLVLIGCAPTKIGSSCYHTYDLDLYTGMYVSTGRVCGK